MDAPDGVPLTGRETQELLEMFGALAPLLKKVNKDPKEEGRDPKKAKTQHKGPETAQNLDLPQVVLQMARLLIRMDVDNNLMRKQDSFVFYMQMEQESVIHVLTARAKSWHWRWHCNSVWSAFTSASRRIHSFRRPCTTMCWTPRGILLPQVGCSQQGPDPDGSSSRGHGENEEVCRSVCGEHIRSSQHNEVPQSSTLRRPADDPMASPGVPALRRVADSVGDPGGMQGLESTGSITQGAYDASKPSGAAVAGQGEECRERQISSMTNVELFDRHALLTALSMLVLLNDQNQCYVNAAMMATLWAILSHADFQPSDLGPKATLIASCILSSASGPVYNPCSTALVYRCFANVVQFWPSGWSSGISFTCSQGTAFWRLQHEVGTLSANPWHNQTHGPKWCLAPHHSAVWWDWSKCRPIWLHSLAIHAELLGKPIWHENRTDCPHPPGVHPCWSFCSPRYSRGGEMWAPHTFSWRNHIAGVWQWWHDDPKTWIPIAVSSCALRHRQCRPLQGPPEDLAIHDA